MTIPDSVKSIDNGVFMNCHDLVSVTFGSGLTKIGREAFAGCSSLESIIFPDNLVEIGDTAFFNSGLSSINIPVSLTKIGHCAFLSCPIREIKCHVKDPEKISIGLDAFAFSYPEQFNICILRVPKGTEDRFRSHPFFGQFKNIVEEDDI